MEGAGIPDDNITCVDAQNALSIGEPAEYVVRVAPLPVGGGNRSFGLEIVFVEKVCALVCDECAGFVGGESGEGLVTGKAVDERGLI